MFAEFYLIHYCVSHNTLRTDFISTGQKVEENMTPQENDVPIFSLIFLFLFMYLQNHLLLPFTSLARFNSRSALTFPTLCLQDRTATLYFSWVTCPCFYLWCFSFMLNSLEMIIHADLLLLFLEFLLVRMDLS